MSTMGDGRIVVHCLETRLTEGFGRIGAARQAYLIEEEPIDFK